MKVLLKGNDEMVQHFDDSSFEQEVIRAQEPVLVDFWAEWCMPCRFIAPTVEQLATDFAGMVKIGKVNVDDHPDIAQAYGITGIPTLLLYKAGKVVDRMVGAMPKPALEQMIRKHIEVN